ncbi:Conserved oligomeric Golgi complex subunit [Paramyrothecium foliicola]|nr:Conserved oligomeric Golgi complex subunit [Paramyrothecium foliicola]
MAEALSDVLGTQSRAGSTSQAYLTHLAELQVDALRSSEPQRLAQTSHSLLLSLQGLSRKSHKSIVESTAGHAFIREKLPLLGQKASDLSQSVPRLEAQAENFATAFSKAGESKMLARRRQALRLLQNSERLVGVMELPPLLTSAVLTNPVTYSSTLDLYAHVRRLASLYPDSALISSVLNESDAAIRQMAADMIATLRAPSLKLAASLRTMGWLKRIIPDLVQGVPVEDALPAMFLVSRLCTLGDTLDALGPLRKLADEERERQGKASQTWSGGQQAEKYLKRYIEVFREHSFSIVSVFRSLGASFPSTTADASDSLRPLPTALSTLPLHLVEMLLATLRTYLPTVKDQASRESILTQVLYCASSLGRLGADFGMLLAVIGEAHWVDIVKRHRMLAGRLESVIGDYKGQQQALN